MQVAQDRSASGDLLERLLAITHDILQAQDITAPLASIAESVGRLFGWRYVSIVAADEPGGDLYRRVLLGWPEHILASRLGEHISREGVKTILLPEFEVLPNCFYNPAEREVFWERAIYLGEATGQEPRSSPDAWHERDSLTLVLPDRDGQMQGYIAVDGPIDGKVPSIDTLRQMQLFVNLVGLALANARAHQTEIDRRKLLEENVRLQNEFFGMVSHEVRSPLAAIRGATSLLETHWDTMGPERREELLGVLGSATTRLATIFEDFLLLSRMDAGQLSLRIVNVPPVAIIEESIARMRSEHPSRAFNVAYLEPVPAVMADEGRFVQVVANLLSNAVKYSYPDTPINVDVKPLGDVVSFAVINEGVGIPESDSEKLFKRFGRLSHENGSTGLGLYICRELVEMMRGSIGLESEAGRRTTFWFTLPRSD
ncbi:MAG: HAMP domain-containing histidine kinase [Candidatus Eremiobacteraeota bacterium]|nr:HAMP domain-containing histidine kinase [Candidatus Eremiobacteraeota bacterium]MBV8374925.1 HAMP domain-containing histidine kinase [Candidatus Eremiobacteraeota bacterium]